MISSIGGWWRFRPCLLGVVGVIVLDPVDVSDAWCPRGVLFGVWGGLWLAWGRCCFGDLGWMG